MKNILSWPTKYIWTTNTNKVGYEYTKEYTFRLKDGKHWAKGITQVVINLTRESQGGRIILAP